MPMNITRFRQLAIYKAANGVPKSSKLAKLPHAEAGKVLTRKVASTPKRGILKTIAGFFKRQDSKIKPDLSTMVAKSALVNSSIGSHAAAREVKVREIAARPLRAAQNPLAKGAADYLKNE